MITKEKRLQKIRLQNTILTCVALLGVAIMVFTISSAVISLLLGKFIQSLSMLAAGIFAKFAMIKIPVAYIRNEEDFYGKRR
jgi:hypothetical protein